MRDSKRQAQRELLKRRQANIGKEKKITYDKHLDFSSYDGNVEFYKPEVTKKGEEDKDNRIDIIPYIVSTEKHPDLKELPIGSEDFFLSYSVHKNVGPENKVFICLEQTYGEHCPICARRTQLYKEGNKVDALPLWPKKRTIYNIIDRNNMEKGIQLWDVSDNLFTLAMDKQFKRSFNIDKIPYIADPEDGMTISFVAEEKSFSTNDGGKGTYYECTGFTFTKREEPYGESIIDKAYPLDSFLIVKDVQEVEDVFYGFTENEQTEQDENEESESTYVDDDSGNFTTNAPIERKPKQEKVETKGENPECPHGFFYGEDYEEDNEECIECKYSEGCK